MMFMPAGLAGLPGTLSRLRQRFGLARAMPLVLLSMGAAILLSLGGAFAIELLQRLFSQDYRSAVRLHPGEAWPPVMLLSREWSPASMATWSVPLLLFAAGLLLAWLARRRGAALEGGQAESQPPGLAVPRTEGAA
jgi:branched-chain amino acid transport system permease protein